MKSPSTSENPIIDFWNGNRSEMRKVYERKVLEEILKATESTFGTATVRESTIDYPGLEESKAFDELGHHLFVTVAGNQKFKHRDVILIPRPIAKNLLGYRIPIIRSKDSNTFRATKTPESLKKMRLGIPSNWVDATIFRHNNYRVIEEGNFDDIFDRQVAGHFDYTTFGANEITGIFRDRASKHEELTINESMMLFYLFPLVFYVHPNMPSLAKRIDLGIKLISESGSLDKIFSSYYGDIVNELKMDQRCLFELVNPLIPDLFADLKPNLKEF